MQEGKIVKALSGFYYVLSNNQIFQCRGRGVFRKDNITPLVGDNVVFQAENELEGYILKIKRRKNKLVRPPIANVDQAVLVFSAVEPDFSPVLLNRFLVFVEAEQIDPIICITKMDLADDQQTEMIQTYVSDYKQIGYDVLLSSTKTLLGITELTTHLQDKISVFAGQSGVGKSSLLNAIDPTLNIKTARISQHLGRGRHTTRHVELIPVGSGFIADTPGFSSIEFFNIEAEQLASCFPEIDAMSHRCKFRGCLHMNEPSCAVKKAVESGEITSYRYGHYKNFLQEIKDRKPRY